jgi:hypothetical protein
MKSTLLPAWGPTSKYLAGAAYATDPDHGTRVEFSFFPALHRRRQSPPFLAWDSGFHPWEAAPDLSQWSFRFPLADKRDFYADIRYARNAEGLEVLATFVNETSLPQAAALHGLITRRFVERGPYRSPVLRPALVQLPPGGTWLSAADYTSLQLRENDPHRHLRADATPWGILYADGFVDGRGLGEGFGSSVGDNVIYTLPAPAARVLLRYRASGERTLHLQGLHDGSIVLSATDGFGLATVPVSNPLARTLRVHANGDGPLELDGFAILPPTGDLCFRDHPLLCTAELQEHPGHLSLQYPDDPGSFSIEWDPTLRCEIREILTDRLEFDFPLATHDHVRKRIGSQGHPFTNVFIRPITVPAKGSRAVRLFLKTDIPPAAAHRPVTIPALLPAPFGVERLRATLLTNVVFPVRHGRGFISHHCPGKFWDSLYTWDSGFIGLGMCEIHPGQAEEILSRYLSAPDDDFAYVHHGSTVPVQIYLLQQLFNLRGDRRLLQRYFLGARRMHRFLSGRSEGSNTAELKSGLLCPFSYFYNSGGWDDYPPQWKLWNEKRRGGVTPVITSAQMIRCARLLRRVALLLGEDPSEFEADITRLEQALFAHSWNPATGWFSYVEHDADGNPLGPVLHESGEDCNAGLDGLYPLLAGICSPEQERDFLARLQDPARFWSPVGLSTVDQSAAVFKPDGYWNGSVWMPHQWFVWRYLLDIGEADFARKISETALDLWEREVAESWCCFEHFPIETGRGAGWHHFGGLSSPILNWQAAAQHPGRLVGGYNAWILAHDYDNQRIEAEILFDGREYDHPVLLAVVPGSANPQVEWTGTGTVHIREPRPGQIEVHFSKGQDRGRLRIHR